MSLGKLTTRQLWLIKQALAEFSTSEQSLAIDRDALLKRVEAELGAQLSAARQAQDQEDRG